MKSNYPNFEIEEDNPGLVAGIDEAGRGPLAGPVVASCVILNKDNYPLNLNDSKKMSKAKRKKAFFELKECAKIGIGIVDESQIDEINILNATKLAMRLAFLDLCSKYDLKPDLVIVDGNFIPQIESKAQFIIKGDQKSLSIAAASIVAKETRDAIMQELGEEFPEYEWRKNQAYPTKFHLDKIKEIGICKYHRKSFAPVRSCL
jgi:ribonuclease HII